MNLRYRLASTWIGIIAGAVPAIPSWGQAPVGGNPARPTLTAAANFSADNAIADDATLEIKLSRPLAPDEGELALVVGGMDVTAVARRTASQIVYQPVALALPAGETQVVLYKRSGSHWTEIRRFVASVAQAATGTRFSAEKSASVGNKGQIAEGRTAGLPAPPRRTFQDFVLNGGLRSAQEHNNWSLTTQSNYVGVTRREEALRFNTRGPRAPMLDLSDYQVALRSPGAALSLGHVTFGNSRHLANAFTARGSTLALTRGATTMTVGALAGSAQVGWSDMIGLERPSNRVLGAAIAHEVLATHPGALRLDATVLDGSTLPIASFNQGAIVDAEQSAGGSLQLSAATPSQRLRLTGGYSRSRFQNPPRDPQLLGDSLVPRPQPVTRGARFVEVSAAPIQNVKMPIGGPATVTFAFRDERVDPLYKSVTVQAPADRQQNAADATISLGAIAGQVSHIWNRDNLGDVNSVLTTKGRGTTGSLAVPLAAAIGIESHAALFPVLTLAHNRLHQFAAGLPTNGAFRPTDLPDQLSTNTEMLALWQVGRARLSFRVNRTAQDNRQELRERADFSSGVHVVSLGTTLGLRGDVALDLGDEFQTSKERDETTRVRRLTLNGSVRALAATNVIGALSVVRTQPPVGGSTLNSEQRLELSQGIDLWPAPGGSQRAQLFIRYARTFSQLPDLSAFGITETRVRQAQWTLSSGLNLRLF